MSTNADEILELLNGLLDGALTDDERSRIDLAMKDDPTLEEKLDELVAMRRSLLRGRSVGRLGPNFARGVVLAARERADMMGDKAPEWLKTPATRHTTPTISDGRMTKPSPSPTSITDDHHADSSDNPILRRAIGVWVPSIILAAAASLVLYLSSSYWAPVPLVQPLVSDFGTERKIEDDISETNKVATELLGLSSESIASLEPAKTPSEMVVEPATETATDRDPVSGSSIASTASQPEPTATSKQVESSSELASVNTSTNDLPLSPEGKLSRNEGAAQVFTMVADFTMDPEAQQNDALRSLLEEYEIVYSDDLNLDQTQLDALIKSQVIGPLSKSKESNSDVSVMFVRARATRIDELLVAMESQYLNFPKFRYDLALSLEPSFMALTNQLRKVVSSDDTARRLTFRNEKELGLVTSFPAGEYSADYMDIEIRKQAAERRSSRKKDVDAVSYLILIVRTSKE